MASDLVVRPAYQFGSTEIVTADKLNLIATPVVQLAMQEPVGDINYFRNGNFYSSFWKTPGGISCPVATETINASYWTVNPNGAAVTYKESSDVPDLFSLFSAEIDGASNVTDVSIGQNINGDLSATLRRPVTFSGYIENNSGSTLSPLLEIWTANAFNNFNTVTRQSTANLQTCANAAWTYTTATVDLTNTPNAANGLLIKVRLPTGALSATGKRINFSRLKIQIGQVATEFSDDPSQFVQTPSVDSTMLQDGCLARSTLYVTNPGVIPKGAFATGAIQSADIGSGQVMAANLNPGIATTTAANFTVPAVNANVAITLTSAAGISVGLVLNIQGAGSYSSVSVAGSVLTAQNLGSSGNALPGTIINSGANVTSGGVNAVIGCLGYTPINKNGDTGIGVIEHDVDTVWGSAAPTSGGVVIADTSANANNANYAPTIGFNRPGVIGRAIGLDISGRFNVMDNTGKAGYLLDSVFQVDTNSYQDGSITLQKLAQSLINIIIPPGMIRMFGGPTIPLGWLVCDGSAVSRTTYVALYAAVGTYWGVGDNITTFNLPDLRGRSPLGYVNSPVGGITGRAFASIGGEENHTLDQNELAPHAHQIADQQHNHGTHNHNLVDPMHAHTENNVDYVHGGTGTNGSYNFYISGPGSSIGINSSRTNITMDLSGVPYSYTGINGTIGAGGGWAHNNMSPFSVLYFIIKT